MRHSRILLTVVAVPVALAACGGDGNGDGRAGPTGGTPALGNGPATCTGGIAGSYACDGISLRKRVPLADMGGTQGNDIWGWVDSSTGREYALMGMDNGVLFVDVTDPENPRIVGRLPTRTTASSWRDIKVFEDYAFVVADGAGAHGMQVFDLTRLENTVPPATFTPDAVYADFANAHNIAIDEDTGFAYVVGTNTCNEGLHIVEWTRAWERSTKSRSSMRIRPTIRPNSTAPGASIHTFPRATSSSATSPTACSSSACPNTPGRPTADGGHSACRHT